jgi:hypothetical protein
MPPKASERIDSSVSVRKSRSPLADVNELRRMRADCSGNHCCRAAAAAEELRNRARRRRDELLAVDLVAEHAADRTAGVEAVQRFAGVSTPERSEASGPSSSLLRCRQPLVQLVDKDPCIFRVVDGHNDEMYASASECPL